MEEIHQLPSPNYAEVKVLYSTAKIAALGAKRALETGGEASFPVYVHEYNRLAVETLRQFGQEVGTQFLLIRLGRALSPNSALVTEWRLYLESASLQLNKLVVYLESKLEPHDRQINQSIERLIIHIDKNLRPSFHKDPQNETEVQDALETILRAGDFEFIRHKVSIPAGAKAYHPDFISTPLDLALEVKFCSESRNISEMIDEINADIVGYQKKYTNTLFVVYDMGIIRDTKQFVSGFEIPNVQVLVVKR